MEYCACVLLARNKVLALDLQEEKVGSRSIYESTRCLSLEFGLADRRSFNIHCTLHPCAAQTSCAKRRRLHVRLDQVDRLIADDMWC